MSRKGVGCSQNYSSHWKSFEHAVREELANTKGCPEMFLRAETDLSRMLKTICFEHARPYISYGLRKVLGKSASNTNVRSSMEHKNIEKQLAAIAGIIERLDRVSPIAPANLRSCCQHMLSEFRSYYHDSPNPVRHTVGNLIVLRTICPILVHPEKMGFPLHTKSLFVSGVQMAKIFQHTLYGRLFDAGEYNAGKLNAFVCTYEPILLAFLADLSSPHPKTQPTALVRHPVATESFTKSYSERCTNWSAEPTLRRHVSVSNMLSVRDHNPKQRKSFSRTLWQKVKISFLHNTLPSSFH
uniref:Uncharacterized protein AlNc14C9G1185 n=1 Tax=Albugo laibachii Nc14 TaxID=890382 RepID=F0W2D5_9STRA|nr:conserved hypothetical protein [Albugo laibachii Nc14]|eukprot:CCA15220.1 conserved hypothetical protein [Albugo laibachii Nc14]